jgi:hypothetical protein
MATDAGQHGQRSSARTLVGRERAIDEKTIGRAQLHRSRVPAGVGLEIAVVEE